MERAVLLGLTAWNSSTPICWLEGRSKACKMAGMWGGQICSLQTEGEAEPCHPKQPHFTARLGQVINLQRAP